MKFFQRLRARPFSVQSLTARERRRVLAATRNKEAAGGATPLATKSPAPARAGFTIVEVLITIGLLILVMFGIYGAYSLMIRLTGQSRAQTVGLQLAQEKIEFIRNLPYQSVGVVGAVPAGVVPASESISRGSVQFTVATTIRNIDDPFDGDAAGSIPGKPVDTDPVDYKRVEVQITCPACPSGSPIVLTTNVVPRGVEAGASTGSLLVRVINKSGQPVSGAAVSIKNAGVSPAVDFTDTVDVNGKLMVVGMPAASGYRLAIAKPGYSSDGTLPPGDPKNPNPVKPDPTIVAGQVTELTFSIDLVSTLVVKAVNQLCESVGYVSAHVQGQTLIGTNPNVPKTSFELATDSYVGGVATTTATSSPAVVGNVQDSTKLSGAIAVFVSGQYAYVAAFSSNRLTVVDTANPSNPTVVGSVRDDTNLRGASSVFVSGRYAYASAAYGNRLTVADIANPSSPTVVGSVRDDTNINNPQFVFVSGRYAYIANSTHRLTVVDIFNPSSPTVVGSVMDETNLYDLHSVFVSGRYAYVASFNNRLSVVDVSNPSSPTLVGSVYDATNLNAPSSVFVSGRYAYVAAYFGNSLTVVDIFNPSSPTVVGSVRDDTNLYEPQSVFVSGRYAYLTGYFRPRVTVVEVSNPSSPTVVSSVNDVTNLANPKSVFVSGRYAYVATFSNRLTVVDLGSYLEAPTPDGIWQKTVANLEADSYSVSLTPLQQYDMVGTIPMLPVNLLPNSNQDLTLVLANKTAHSLRVSLRDSATGLPLSDAEVTLQRGQFDQTIQSGAGYFNQTDWSGGPGQDTYGNYTRYWADDGNVDTTGSAAGKIALKKIGGEYPASGTLISSTVDFGESVNPTSLLWNQSVQFIEGPPPQKFQIATNNDNATWNFLGPDGTANTFYTVGNTSLNAIHSGSRYLRYQVTLEAPSGGGPSPAQAPPEIHDIAVTYAKGCATPGQAFFSDVPTATYNLKIRKDGYQSLTNQVTVNGATSIDVVLSPLQ